MRDREHGAVHGRQPERGQLRRLVDWTASAWNDIQKLRASWRWMRRPFTSNTVLNDDNYARSMRRDITEKFGV